MDWILVECCDEWIKRDDLIVTKEGESYCQDCAESDLHHCEVCGEWTSEDECCEEDEEDDICTDKIHIQPAYQEIMIGKIVDTISVDNIGIVNIENWAGWWIVIRRNGTSYYGGVPNYPDDHEFCWKPESFSNILTIQIPVIPRDSSYVKEDNEISTN